MTDTHDTRPHYQRPTVTSLSGMEAIHHCVCSSAKTIDELHRQRAELLAALKLLVQWPDRTASPTEHFIRAIRVAKDVIAKVKGAMAEHHDQDNL